MSDPQTPRPPYASPTPQPDGYPTSNGYPQQPTGYPQQPAYAAPPAGSLGRTAFIVAMVDVAVSTIFIALTPALIISMRNPSAFGLFSLGRSILGLALGAFALILGILAARRGAQPVLAGIAIGLGGAEILGIIVSFVANLLAPLLL